MVAVSCVPVNVTWALAAGPRTTSLVPNPCWGLHDTKYTRVPAQLATSVPPREVSTVPPPAPVEGAAPAERWAFGGGGAVREGDGEADRRGMAALRSAVSLASARLTVSTLT